MKEVLVLGGGIGGVEAAIQLRKAGLKVRLISDRDYLYIYPLSIWVPTKTIEFEDLKIPLKGLASVHGFDLTIDTVTDICVSEKRVALQEHEMPFDALIIALGGEKVQHKGMAHTISICAKPEDSIKLKDKLEELIEKGSGKIAIGFGGNPKDPSGVRGGPAFELVFNVLHYLKKKNIRNNFEISFFAPMELPGARLGEGNAKRVADIFDKLGVKRYYGKKIKEFIKDGVIFEDNSNLASDLIMFISATAGHSVFKDSDLPLNEAGFIRTNECCQIYYDDNDNTENIKVFAIGDSAALQGPSWRAKQGHLADIMAKVAVKNLGNIEKGSPERESYLPHVSILCLMDMGNSGILINRTTKRTLMIPLFIVGHWMKKAWGWYYKNNKLARIPRLPGL